jgi:hypothetical protein
MLTPTLIHGDTNAYAYPNPLVAEEEHKNSSHQNKKSRQSVGGPAAPALAHIIHSLDDLMISRAPATNVYSSNPMRNCLTQQLAVYPAQQIKAAVINQIKLLPHATLVNLLFTHFSNTFLQLVCGDINTQQRFAQLDARFLVHIFHFLAPCSLIKARHVCTRWHAVSYLKQTWAYHNLSLNHFTNHRQVLTIGSKSWDSLQHISYDMILAQQSQKLWSPLLQQVKLFPNLLTITLNIVVQNSAEINNLVELLNELCEHNQALGVYLSFSREIAPSADQSMNDSGSNQLQISPPQISLRDQDLASLAQLQRLQRLNLQSNVEITEQALEHLVTACPGLISLNLLGCGAVTDLSLAQIAVATHLQELSFTINSSISSKSLYLLSANASITVLRVVAADFPIKLAQLIAFTSRNLVQLELNGVECTNLDNIIAALAMNLTSLRQLKLLSFNSAQSGLFSSGISLSSAGFANFASFHRLNRLYIAVLNPAAPFSSEQLKLNLLKMRNVQELEIILHQDSWKVINQQEIRELQFKFLNKRICIV